MDNTLYDKFFEVEQHHWWFVARRRIVFSLLDKFLPAGSRQGLKVYDVGCGCGINLSELARLGFDATGVEPSDTALAYCRARGVRVVKGALPDALGLPEGSADAMLLLDVLEHIDDDRRSFASVMKVLRPGGILICTVPAYAWLFGGRDVLNHHKRRYGWADFANILGGGIDSQVLLHSYMNLLLFPPAAAFRLAFKILPFRRAPSELSLVPVVNRLALWAFGGERRLLTRGLRLPFGLSMVAVVRRRSSP